MNIALTKFTDTDYEIAPAVFEDTDAEFLLSYKNKAKSLSRIFADGRLAGLVQLIIENNAFLYIFIFPEFRNQGIGTDVLRRCEERLSQYNIGKIITTYRTNHIGAKRFAGKYGYGRNFSSAYMKYSGGRFELSELPIRGYCDQDYDAAHEMYAEAFHKMRVSVGDFPDSVIEQPSGKMRERWAKTASERLVYINKGMIVGYAHIDGHEIGSVSVKPQCQGHGIGRNFVKYICNTILDGGNDFVSLYCVVGNKARGLYDSLGFREVYTAEYASKCIK